MVKTIVKLFCPFCGEEMLADIHAIEDGAKWKGVSDPEWAKDAERARQYDHWLCNSGDRLTCKVIGDTVFFDRDDIKDWLEW